MAVVQISRIQVRRGKKQDSDIPQLASGELGWALDTQELFIGNGSTAEGAPETGNTKILTTADDLLELAGQYAYKRDDGNIQTGPSINSPIERSVQSKLDDFVSLFDFLNTEERRAVEQGNIIDVTVPLQRAIDNLYLNSDKGIAESRVPLYIPPGTYTISGDGVRLPPYANIVGAGIDRTVFISSVEDVPGHIFSTVNGDSSIGVYADPSSTTVDNMARLISLTGVTINHTSFGGALLLENCKDSKFEDIKFVGPWDNAQGISNDGDPVNNWVAVYLSNGSNAAPSTDYNIFSNIFINGFSCGVWSDYDINYNKFLNGKIETCGLGFVFGVDQTALGEIPGGKQNGPQNTLIKDYVFDSINKQGLYVRTGNFTRSESNIYLNVGRDNSDSVVVTPVIEFFRTDLPLNDDFIEMSNNVSINDYFQRTQELTVDPLYFTQSYITEVLGAKRVDLTYPVKRELGVLLTPDTVIRLPADQNRGVIELEYTYRAEKSVNPVMQYGKMTIIYNTLSGSDEITFFDENTFTGNPSKAGQLEFTVKGDAIQPGKDEIWIDCQNTVLDEADPDADQLEFTIKYIV